jgi:hypothetical protein
MTDKEKQKRAQERQEDDARHARNCLLLLEAMFGPLPKYEIAGRVVTRDDFLVLGHEIVMKDIRTRQRRERTLKRAQRDPAGGEDRHSS